eukprot:COSAG06_NODE_371_length_16707_cov_57.805576_14_plen_71_part_00
MSSFPKRKRKRKIFPYRVGPVDEFRVKQIARLRRDDSDSAERIVGTVVVVARVVVHGRWCGARRRGNVDL